MVGGYVIILGKTLEFGDHDLVEAFGSYEAANDYINRLFTCGKQIKGSVRTPAGNVFVGNYEPLTYGNPNEGTIGGIISLVINMNGTNRTLKVTIGRKEG